MAAPRYRLTITFCLGAHHGAASSLAAAGAPQPLYYISQQRIPSRKAGERLRLCCPRMAALAFERQHILAEVVG